MSHKVFISSTRNDIELAKDLAQRLRAAGIEVFQVDKTVVPGGRILAQVNRALTEADEVMVILTSASSDSPGLLSEMGMASALQKQITPVVVNLDPQALPPPFKQLRHVRYADLGDYINQLATRVQPRHKTNDSGQS